MPSWPPRLYLGSPTPGPGPKPRARALNSAPYHEDLTGDDTYHNPPLHGVPIIALTSTSGPSRLNHGRSHSHPFPSIFGAGKKKESLYDPDRNDDALETLAESPFIPSGLATKDYMTSSGTSVQDKEKDLVIGKCITCNSLVRWPRRLNVFRCTVCLTVNDLKPGAGLLIEDHEAGGRNTIAAPFSNPGLPRKGTTTPGIELFSNSQQQFRICLSTGLETSLTNA